MVGGASSQGVGVSGWMLGAGYSLKSNRYGLGIDNLVEYEVVVPDGRILTVSKEKDEKLFQALRVRCALTITSSCHLSPAYREEEIILASLRNSS